MRAESADSHMKWKGAGEREWEGRGEEGNGVNGIGECGEFWKGMKEI